MVKEITGSWAGIIAAMEPDSYVSTHTIGRATVIAAPIIAVMFILGTSAVLAFSTPEQVDLIAPIPQAIRRGVGSLGAATIIAPGQQPRHPFSGFCRDPRRRTRHAVAAQRHKLAG